MNKKTKHATVSDFRLQLNTLPDSPFSRETVSEVELDLRAREKLVIDFGDETPTSTLHCAYNFSDAGSLCGQSGALGHRNALGGSAAVYAFEEHAHVYFADVRGTSYHACRELALLNNRLSVSLLRFDFDNAVHHFRSLKRHAGKSADVYASACFFERRFDALLLSTTLHSKVALDDFEAGKRVAETQCEGAGFARAWDELYGVCDAAGYLSVYDVRDPSCAVRQVRCASGDARGVTCTDMHRLGSRVLVSTDRETLLFDLRKHEHALSHKQASASGYGKRNSLTYLDEEGDAGEQTRESVHCAKSFFVGSERAVVADFVSRTLDLHALGSLSIEKSLYFSTQLLDVAYCARADRVAVLAQNEDGRAEVAVCDSDLSLQRVLPLPHKQYTNVGWLGDEGKLLVHSRNDYAVLDLAQRTDFDAL